MATKISPFVFLALFADVVLLAASVHLRPNNHLNTLLLPILLFDVVLWVIYKVEIYPRLLSPLRHLPRLKGGYPLIRHGMLPFKRPIGDFYLKVLKEVPNDGIILYRGFFNAENLFLTSNEAHAEVLVAHTYDFQKPRAGAEFLSRVLGKGLVVVEGDLHKFQRKNIMPSFGFRQIKNLYPTYWSKATALTERVAAESLGQPPFVDEKDQSGVVDVFFWSGKVTLDIIGIAGLGRDFNSLSNFDDELVNLYQFITDPSQVQTRILFSLSMMGLGPLGKLLLRSHDQRLIRSQERLRVICREFVAEKRQALKTEGKASVDLLSNMIESNIFSDDDLVDQLLTFLAAGHETTSSTFAWVTYLLATHKDIQAQLREEIRRHIPQKKSTTTNEVNEKEGREEEFDIATTLESLPLLNGVCNETLRLYPTVPITFRVAIRDTTITNVHIPAGTRIAMVPWAINRSPDLWGPESETFNPSRWIDQETGKPNNTGGAKSNYSVLTFLHGPRSCIGQGFARGELRALVAAFVGAFEFELADPGYVPVPAGVVTTKPKDGMPLRLRKVGEW